MLLDDKFRMIPKYTVTSCVRMLAETLDYNHKLMNIPEAWKESKGEGIKIAVLDTGCPEHIDLSPSGHMSMIDGYEFDKNGHACHVGGAIAAIANNGIGIVGVSPDVEDHYVAVLDENGTGSIESIINGIRYAVDVVGADVITMSLGIDGSVGRIPELEKICDYAVSRGTAVFAAAGNEAGKVGQPAQYDSVIAVAAVNSAKEHASFSNTGPEVDFACGGVQTYSTYLNNSYAKLSGTCIAEGEYVYTIDGPETIENVEPGTEVFAYSGGRLVTRKITARHFRGTNKVYKLTSGGRSVKLTGEHKVLAVDIKKHRVEWVPVLALEPDHRLVLPGKMTCRTNSYLDEVLSDDFCWLLGFFLGDGWMSATGGAKQIPGTTSKTGGQGLRVCFATGDKEDVINEVRSKYQSLFGKMLKHNNSGTWEYDDSTKTAAIISTLGLNAYAKDKLVPLWLWQVSESKQLAFYKGYLAADGNTYAHKNCNTLAHKFECMSEGLVRRLGMLIDYAGRSHSTLRSSTRLNKAPNSKEPRLATSFCMSVSGNLQRYSGWACLGLRKNDVTDYPAIEQKLGLSTTEFMLANYKVAEAESEVKVYDLTVPDADCFVTGGIITHNSMACPNLAAVGCLILSMHKAKGEKLTPAELKEHIKRIAFDVGPAGFDEIFGHGIPVFGHNNTGLVTPGPVVPAPAPDKDRHWFNKKSMPSADCLYWKMWNKFTDEVAKGKAVGQDPATTLMAGLDVLISETARVNAIITKK